MYGNVRGDEYLTAKKNADAFAPRVLELAGHYINSLVIQKFTRVLCELGSHLFACMQAQLN